MYFLDLVPIAAQEAREPYSVGAGAFDTEREQAAAGADVLEAEREELGETVEAGWDEQLGQAAPDAVEQDCDVLVLVGVDTDDDIVLA